MSEVSSTENKESDVIFGPEEMHYYRTLTVGQKVSDFKYIHKQNYSLFKDVVRIHLRDNFYAFLTNKELEKYDKLKREDFEPSSEKEAFTPNDVRGMWRGTLLSLEVNETVADKEKADAIKYIRDLLLGTQAQ